MYCFAEHPQLRYSWVSKSFKYIVPLYKVADTLFHIQGDDIVILI